MDDSVYGGFNDQRGRLHEELAEEFRALYDLL